MNCKNANRELGFDRFSECNYNLHWSFSNFNRILMVAGHIAQLPSDSKVLELGAGSSDLENVVKKNFKRDDIKFIKIDGDKQYESNSEITVFDITSNECKNYCVDNGPYNAVVFMEVIEHLSREDGKHMIGTIHDLLVPEGLMLFTTPTPPCFGKYEDRVWPLDHKIEYDYHEIYDLINPYFKITKEIGWSMEEREYNKVLGYDKDLSLIHAKLSKAFPESYVRAIIACLSPIHDNRQVFFACRKRRFPNGRPTQTR